MSNETISIEIPAPPPKGATDLEYSQWFQKAKNCLHALYDDQQQEPRELPAVEGWVREGDYWLAPIEWDAAPYIDGIHGEDSRYTPDLGHMIYNTPYRCVGFLRMGELEDYRAKCYRRPLKHCVRTCPCLLDWQATHAVMQKEEG